MEKMNKYEKTLHKVVISILMSFLVWFGINSFLVKITLIDFIYIEIAIGFGQFFSTFIKKKAGLISKDVKKKIANEQCVD